jgi:signal peptide peptidase SppA
VSNRVLDAALGTTWAIRPEALRQLLDIAARANAPDFEAAAEKLVARYREIQPEAVALTEGTRLSGTNSIRMRGNTAVLPIEGPTFRYGNLFTSMSGATSLEMLAKDLNVALNSSDVESILLHVDSPGGQVNGTGEFAEHIFAARGKKPIWAYVSNEGASAAYWITSACDRVVCAPTAILGSIGVVAAVPNPSAEDPKRIQFVSSQSPNKRPDLKTDEGRATIQTVMDDLASEFIKTVARNRNVTADQVVSDFGAGGVFVGQKAVEAGLADAVGNFEQCLVEIGKAKSSKAEEPTVAKPAQAASANTSPSGASPSKDGNQGNPTVKSPKRKGRHMGFKERLLAAINGTPDEEFDDDDKPAAQLGTVNLAPAIQAPVAPVVTAQAVGISGQDLELRQLRERATRLEDENRRIKASRIQERAEGFWSTLFAGRKAVPSEREGIIRGWISAATDDEIMPRADGSSRSDEFEQMYQARPANMLLAESVPDALNDVIMLRNQMQSSASLNGRTPDGKAMSDSRKQELLAMTDLGKEVLQQKNGRN